MTDCREVEPLLTPYVDGEIEPPVRAAVDEHLRACPPCRDRVGDERTARTLILTRKEALRASAPAELKRACAAQRSAAAPTPIAPPARRVPRRAILPLSVAATFLLAVGGVFFFGVNQDVEVLAAQLALDHVKCFQFQPTEVDHEGATALGLEWAKKRGWPLTVPASSPEQELDLLAVRRCVSTEGLTAHIMYRWRGAPLSVYVVNSPAPYVPERGALVEKLGQEAVVWSRGGRTYAVVARAQPKELESVVKYVKLSAW